MALCIVINSVTRPIKNQYQVYLNFFHQNFYFLVIFELKISPLIHAPFWKISRSRDVYYEQYGIVHSEITMLFKHDKRIVKTVPYYLWETPSL